MARTITLDLYQYHELSPEAQRKAIQGFKNDGGDRFYYEDTCAEIFDSWYMFESLVSDFATFKQGDDHGRMFFTVDMRSGWYTEFSDYDVYEKLRGPRLMAFLHNNLFRDLYPPRVYSQFFTIDGHSVLKHHRSGVYTSTTCPLTGTWADNAILAPIYDVLEGRDQSSTLLEVMEACASAVCKMEREALEYSYTDECIVSFIETNDVEFYEDGTQY